MYAKVSHIIPTEAVDNRMNTKALQIQGKGEIQGQVKEMLKYNQQRG